MKNLKLNIFEQTQLSSQEMKNLKGGDPYVCTCVVITLTMAGLAFIIMALPMQTEDPERYPKMGRMNTLSSATSY